MKTQIDKLYNRYLAGVVWKTVAALFTGTEAFFVYVLKRTHMTDGDVTLFSAIMAGLIIFCLLLIPKKGIALALNLVHEAEKNVAVGTATLSIVAPSAASTAAKVAEDVLPCLDEVLTGAEAANVGTAEDAPSQSSVALLPEPAEAMSLIPDTVAIPAVKAAGEVPSEVPSEVPPPIAPLIENLITHPPTSAEFFAGIGSPATK